MIDFSYQTGSQRSVIQENINSCSFTYIYSKTQLKSLLCLCSFGVEKKILSFVVVELYPFKSTTVKFYTRFQAKRLREYVHFQTLNTYKV